MKQKYINAFMDMAERFGETSEATRLKVGAILVKDTRVISLGVNGQPSGWPTEQCEDDMNCTLPTVRHAEKAALDKLRRSPESAEGSMMFVSHCPCLPCAIEMLDAGVKAVYYRYDYRSADGIKYLLDKGLPVYKIPQGGLQYDTTV